MQRNQPDLVMQRGHLMAHLSANLEDSEELYMAMKSSVEEGGSQVVLSLVGLYYKNMLQPSYQSRQRESFSKKIEVTSLYTEKTFRLYPHLEEELLKSMKVELTTPIVLEELPELYFQGRQE